jgi:RNA polymerase primary sigma factor
MRQLKIVKQITDRSSASLDKYLQEIGKVELISVEEEVKLAKRSREGDENAAKKLTKANLRFVVSVAKQYQNQGLSLPELINAGNSGLMKAIKKFDETRGFKLISYAVWWIRQTILQALAEDSRTVRMPINVVAAKSKINKAFEKFVQEEQRKPLPFELAEILEIPTDKVIDTLSAAHCVSFDAPITQDVEDGSLCLLDLIANDNSPSPDRGVNHESLSIEIHRALNTLTERESKILSMFFGLDGQGGKTLEEIGEEFGLTRERVRQIKEKAIKRLRNPIRAKALKEFAY